MTTTAPVLMVMRARIILAAAAGTPDARIAAAADIGGGGGVGVGVGVGTVRRVRHRYVTEGITALHDRPRPGQPLVYDVDVGPHLVRGRIDRPDDPGSSPRPAR